MIEINSKRNTFSVKSRRRNNVAQKGRKTTPINSIVRATNILRCLRDSVHSIKDIAEHCGLSQATVHRILQTLEDSELVFQDPTNHKYYLGPLFAQLSLNQINAHQYLIVQSVEEVNRIWDLFGEFTALDVEVGWQMITLIEVQSRFNYGITRLSKPMFYGSLSKVLMAQKSDAEIDTILNAIVPKPLTEYCITDKEKLKEEFQEVRRQGYSVSRKEITEGIMGISVPIKNYHYPAVLSIVGPEIRLDTIIDKAIEEMMTSAKRISGRLLMAEARQNPKVGM